MRRSICSPTGSMSGLERRRPTVRPSRCGESGRPEAGTGLYPQCLCRRRLRPARRERRGRPGDRDREGRKAPVKLIWTREEDTRQDKFRPHAVVRFKAGVGADGMPTAWSMRVVTSSILSTVGRPLPQGRPERQAVAGLDDNGYNMPNVRVEAASSRTRIFRCGSGVRRARTSMSSRSRASSTRSQPRAIWIPTKCGASCWKASRTG